MHINSHYACSVSGCCGPVITASSAHTCLIGRARKFAAIFTNLLFIYCRSPRVEQTRRRNHPQSDAKADVTRGCGLWRCRPVPCVVVTAATVWQSLHARHSPLHWYQRSCALSIQSSLASRCAINDPASAPSSLLFIYNHFLARWGISFIFPSSSN